MAELPKYEFNHKELGTLVGIARGDDIVQFRGIPYASIPARFRQSQLLGSLPQQPYDARQPGPYCPQPVLPFPTYWDGEAPSDHPRLNAPVQDEFGCLNLDITMPRAALENHGKLPVFFYIHGGAFVGGSKSLQLCGREVYDGCNFARAAIARGQPICVVTCNYRVGPLGFLHSAELSAYNKANGEAVGNYGLHDQRQALEWCSRFISGFGGDADNVTIQGTSAGGSSVHYLSIFPERKFKRAILASGTMTGIGPMSLEYHQKAFEKYAARHMGSKAIAEKVVEGLQSVAVDELVKPVSGGISHPLIDGDWIPGGTMESVKAIDSAPDAPDWMIGACDFEADLTQLLLMDMNFETKKPAPDDKMLHTIFDICSSNGMIVDAHSFPLSSGEVREAYGITSDSLGSAFHGWADLLADVAFRIPPIHIAQQSLAHKRKVFVYNMRTPNPYPEWDWSFGRANHAVNDLFIFDPAPDQVPEELRDNHNASVAQVRGTWLDFCYGKEPWSSARKGKGGVGPIFNYEDGGRGKECETLDESIGTDIAHRWRSVLAANRWEA